MQRSLRPLVRTVGRQTRSVSSETKLTVLPNQMRVATGERETPQAEQRLELCVCVCVCAGRLPPARGSPVESGLWTAALQPTAPRGRWKPPLP